MKYETPHYDLLEECYCSMGTVYRRFVPTNVKSEKELVKRWVGYKFAGTLYWSIHLNGHHVLFDPLAVPKESN